MYMRIYCSEHTHGPEQPCEVRSSREFEAGNDFLRDGGTTDDLQQYVRHQETRISVGFSARDTPWRFWGVVGRGQLRGQMAKAREHDGTLMI